MQLPCSCLRKPVNFEVLRSTERTGYLLHTDLLCFGWTALNENTTQRVFAAYLHFWTPLKLSRNVQISQTPSWNCLQQLAQGPKPSQRAQVGLTELKEMSGRLVGQMDAVLVKQHYIRGVLSHRLTNYVNIQDNLLNAPLQKQALLSCTISIPGGQEG